MIEENTRRAPPKLSGPVPTSQPLEKPVSESVPGQKEGTRRAPPKLARPTPKVETRPSADPAPSEQVERPAGPVGPESVLNQAPDIDSDTQRKMVNEIASNPEKIAGALRQFNAGGAGVSDIVANMKKDPEAMKEIKRLSERSGLQHQVESALSRGQSHSHGDERPSRKKIMKMQKEMKKAMHEAAADDTTPTFQVVHVTLSRKFKRLELKALSAEELAKKAALSMKLGADFEVIQKKGMYFVCSTKSNQRNKVLEKILGKGHGGEAVVFAQDPDGSPLDLSVAAFTKKI